MTDIWSKKKRSEVMSRIRSHGNQSTEAAAASLFRRLHIVGWRRHQRLPGRPDFVFRDVRVCVFIDGCFWHGCPKCYSAPKSSQNFWAEKVTRNRARDLLVSRQLRKSGWRVLRIWEHELSAHCSASLRRRLRTAQLLF